MNSITHIAGLIEADSWRMEVLYAVQQLNLPDWAIGAGFVRSAVWDAITGNKNRTPLNDIDVLHLNTDDTRKSADKELEKQLNDQFPGIAGANWSVKNQARMHIQNHDRPYLNTEDAISNWLEVTSCIGARLRPDLGVDIIAPYGIEDLLNMRVRPTFRGKQKPDQYNLYLSKKNWPLLWPKVDIERLEAELV